MTASTTRKAQPFASTTLWIVSVLVVGCWLVTVQATITTYPLVPHHAQRIRRHRERALIMSTSAEQVVVGVPSSVSSNSTSSASTTAAAAALELELEEDHSWIRRRDVAQQVGALYQGYGTHYIDLWCGSPPQRQTVIVDTGSGVTAFPCSGCRDCGVPKYHIDALFDESASSTFRHNSCEGGCVSDRSHCTSSECKISMSYAEGSRWDAFEAVDSCYVGGPHEQPLLEDDGGHDDLDPGHAKNFAFDLVFGCQTLVTGLFKTQLADGIMGMDSRDEAFWAQMHKAGKMGDEKKFSLCFSRSPTAEREGTEAGALTLGGVDERFDISPMVYTPDASKGRSGFFSVEVRRVWLRDGSAGESAKSSKTSPSDSVKALEVSEAILNTGGIIVDSGTTDTYWNRGIASAFQKVFKEMSGRDYSNSGLTLTHEELMALPTILFQLKSSQLSNMELDNFKTTGLAGALDSQHPYDVILAFPPSHYMEYDPDTNKYTSRFYVTEGRGSVLGANAMMGHNILFDSDMDRIGWAESNCDYTHLVKDNGYDFSITGTLQSAPPHGAPVVISVPATSPPVMAPTAPVAAPTSPTAKPPVQVVPVPVSAPTLPPMTAEGLQDAYKEFLKNCDTAQCWYPAIVGIAILVCCGACFCYALTRFCCSCCFRRSQQEDYHKYEPAAVHVDEVELVSYRDEPSDDDDDDDDDDEKPATNGHGRSKFQDKESLRQPEFHGDFI